MCDHLARRDITGRGVQYIIDSVISALLENPERRFIYVEMAYFWRWWNEQTDDMRNTVKELVNEGYKTIYLFYPKNINLFLFRSS